MLYTNSHFLIIILFLIITLVVLIKVFFSYSKKKNSQKQNYTDSSLFLKEGELLDALTTAPKDSRGKVDVVSALDHLIETKSDEQIKTGKQASFQYAPVKHTSTERQNNRTNGNKHHKNMNFNNNSGNNYLKEDSSHIEKQRMTLLEEVVSELKLTDSEWLEKKNNNHEKPISDNSSQNKNESYNLTIEKYKSKRETRKKEHTYTIKGILNEFITLKGVNAICLIRRDGTIIESLSTSSMNFDFISTHASTLVSTSELLGKEQEKGSLTMTTIEFNKGFIIGSPINEERTLIIDAGGEATLGMIRYLLNKHRNSLASEMIT